MLRFRVLGPFQVEHDGRPLILGSVRRRALLALLTLNAGRVVGVERLVDALWGESPPRTAVHVLHVYVSDLRRSLPDEVLVTAPPGYLLRVPAGAVDLADVERSSGPPFLLTVLESRVQMLEPFTREIVAEHALVAPGETSVIDEHYGSSRPDKRGRTPRAKPVVDKRFLALGNVAKQFLVGAAAAWGEQAPGSACWSRSSPCTQPTANRRCSPRSRGRSNSSAGAPMMSAPRL